MVLCRQIPDWRAKKGRDYPLHCLLAIMVMATLSGIVRGQRDLAQVSYHEAVVLEFAGIGFKRHYKVVFI